jgi:hypothetical protein
MRRSEMIKQALIVFILLFKINLVFAQITSNEEASRSLEWLIQNPQIDSIKTFEKKSVEIFKWYAINYPQLNFRTTGIGEFIDSEHRSQFYREIMMIYNLSELDNQVNKKVSTSESAYLALKNVLDYYNNLTQINEVYKHPLLEEYNDLSDGKLRRRINKP